MIPLPLNAVRSSIMSIEIILSAIDNGSTEQRIKAHIDYSFSICQKIRTLLSVKLIILLRILQPIHAFLALLISPSLIQKQEAAKVHVKVDLSSINFPHISAIIIGPVKLVEFSIMSLMYVILIQEIVQFAQKIDQYGIKQYLLV